MININFLQYFSLLRFKVLNKLIDKGNYTLILDMEDSAQNLFSDKKTIELKKRCREGIHYLSENKIKLDNCFLRINSIKSSFFQEDIKTIIKAKKKILKLKEFFYQKLKILKI